MGEHRESNPGKLGPKATMAYPIGFFFLFSDSFFGVDSSGLLRDDGAPVLAGHYRRRSVSSAQPHLGKSTYNHS